MAMKIGAIRVGPNLPGQITSMGGGGGTRSGAGCYIPVDNLTDQTKRIIQEDQAKRGVPVDQFNQTIICPARNIDVFEARVVSNRALLNEQGFTNNAVVVIAVLLISVFIICIISGKRGRPDDV